MAKGERVKMNTRLVLQWRIDYPDKPSVFENHAVQVPPLPDSFVLNLKYRDTKIRYDHPGCTNVFVSNPAAPDRWHSYEDNRGQFGMMKRLYRNLVTDPIPKCPHCGKAIEGV